MFDVTPIWLNSSESSYSTTLPGAFQPILLTIHPPSWHHNLPDWQLTALPNRLFGLLLVKLHLSQLKPCCAVHQDWLCQTLKFNFGSWNCMCGAGAVLLKEADQGVDHPVCYFSQKLNKNQHYSTIDIFTLKFISELATTVSLIMSHLFFFPR